MSNKTMHVTRTVRIQNALWRHDESTGFLRCTAVILSAAVMPYSRAEVMGAGMPDTVVGDIARIYVPPVELASEASIKSLEGMPVTVGHVWQTAECSESRCGSVAGAPKVTGLDLISDLVVTDPQAVARVMANPADPDLLQEISSAYDARVVWVPGVSPEGEAYDGYFVGLEYNHVALLPPGNGRGGATVRIINVKTSRGNSMEFVSFKLPRTGLKIRIANDDVDVMEKEVEAGDKLIDASEVEKLMADLKNLNDEIARVTAERDEIQGKLETFKEKLDEAVSDETVEKAATEMVSDRADAIAVTNAHGGAVAGLDKLRGHKLRAAAVNAVRVKNGKPELTKEETENEAFVRGLYTGMKELASMGGASVPPAGHGAAFMNQNGVPNQLSPADIGRAKVNALYGAK